MRILIRNTTLEGEPIAGDGEVFEGKTVLDVVRAMKGASLFSDHRDVESYIDMVLRNAKMLAGIELAVKGETIEEKAASFLDALVAGGLAEFPDDTAKEGDTARRHVSGVRVPAAVLEGSLAVRRCGLTNMLDRPVVADLAEKLGFPDAARWIETLPRDYAEGVFRGFEAEEGGGR